MVLVTMRVEVMGPASCTPIGSPCHLLRTAGIYEAWNLQGEAKTEVGLPSEEVRLPSASGPQSSLEAW